MEIGSFHKNQISRNPISQAINENDQASFFGNYGQKKPSMYLAIDQQRLDLVQKELNESNLLSFSTIGNFRRGDFVTGEEERIPPVFYAVTVFLRQKEQTRKSIAHDILKLLLDFGADPNHEVRKPVFFH